MDTRKKKRKANLKKTIKMKLDKLALTSQIEVNNYNGHQIFELLILQYFQEKYNHIAEIILFPLTFRITILYNIQENKFLRYGLGITFSSDCISFYTDENIKELVDITEGFIYHAVYEKGKKIVCNPVTFNNHANVIIYRAEHNTLELYEPQGAEFCAKDPYGLVRILYFFFLF